MKRKSAQRTLKPKLQTILLLTALAIAAQGSIYAGINDWTNVGPIGGAFSGYGLCRWSRRSLAIIYGDDSA